MHIGFVFRAFYLLKSSWHIQLNIYQRYFGAREGITTCGLLPNVTLKMSEGEKTSVINVALSRASC